MELSRMRPRVLKAKPAILAMLFLLSVSVGGQAVPPFPEDVPQHLQVSQYVNHALGFELSYPIIYHSSQSTVPSPPSYREQWKVLLHVVAGSGKARCEDEGECDKFGRVIVALDRRRFNLEAIERYYAHTGWDAPVTFRVGGNTFYYFGTGGGGVPYPDTFLYDLNGRILVIEFDGPYPEGKSPSVETRGIEKVVLQSFRLRAKPQPSS